MPCTTVLVGKKASNDHSTMIARTDDGHFDVKKVIVVRPEDQPKVYKSVISHVEIPFRKIRWPIPLRPVSIRRMESGPPPVLTLRMWA